MPSFKGLAFAGPLVPAPGQVRFSLNGVPERERPFVLREIFGRELTKYDLEPLPDVPLEVELEFLALPGLAVLSGREHGSRAMRSRETLAADPTDDIAMAVNLGGPLLMTVGQKEVVLGDGEATLLPFGEVCSSAHRPPGGFLELRVPRNELAPLVKEVDALYCRRIPEATPALRLLIDYVKAAQDEEKITRPELQHLLVKHIYDLMALACGATRDAADTARDRGLSAARLNAVKADVATNLDQPNLSVAIMAHRHGLTERSLQRLFEAEGATFTDYVLSQRLARAHRWLTDPSRESEKISTVAWDCGFGDVSYFNRAFRRRYGLAPSDIRARARQEVPGSRGTRRLNSVGLARLGLGPYEKS